MTTAFSPSRRTVLAGACMAGCAALAGCATYSSGSGPAPSGSGGGGTAGAGTSGPLTSTADIPVGGGKIFPDQQVVVTQPTSGQFKAFSSVCTHQGCQVGSVESGAIVCPCHGSEFSITDGAVLAGPARLPLPPRSVTVSGQAISLA